MFTGKHRANSTFDFSAASLQLCPTLCDPRDGSTPASPVPGILQARTLENFLLSITQSKTMTSGPTVLWEMQVEKIEAVTDYLFWLKIH